LPDQNQNNSTTNEIVKMIKLIIICGTVLSLAYFIFRNGNSDECDRGQIRCPDNRTVNKFCPKYFEFIKWQGESIIASIKIPIEAIQADAQLGRIESAMHEATEAGQIWDARLKMKISDLVTNPCRPDRDEIQTNLASKSEQIKVSRDAITKAASEKNIEQVEILIPQLIKDFKKSLPNE